MMVRFWMIVLCLVTVPVCGCGKTGSAVTDQSEAGTAGNAATLKTPQYVIEVVQLHPSGRYWKRQLGNPREGEGHANGFSVRFPPEGERTFPLDLAFRYVEHKDGEDVYRVSRSNPPDGENSWNTVGIEIRFRGEPSIAFNDEYGTTLVMSAKQEANR